MANARLEVHIGSIKFVGEGSEEWVEQQWLKVLEQAEQLSLVDPKESKAPPVSKTDGIQGKPSTSLANFLIEKSTGASQVKRFLATAIWLSKSGTTTLKTSDVSKALLDARQKKLGNPADVLNQNVTKGFCVKHGDGFYVSPEGESSLGS